MTTLNLGKLILGSLAATVTLNALAQIRVPVTTPIAVPRIPSGTLVLSPCQLVANGNRLPDLAVTLKAEIIRRINSYSGDVRLTASVTNSGNVDFRHDSANGFYLVGGRSETYATTGISYLRRGEKLTLSTVILRWTLGDEFRWNEYSAYVNFDPDTTTAQCSYSNDFAKVTASQIDALFR